MQHLVSNSGAIGVVTMDSRPPGCFYHPSTVVKFYWNKDKNGKACSACISVCKGTIVKSLYSTLKTYLKFIEMELLEIL
jgi:hypothetical protein